MKRLVFKITDTGASAYSAIAEENFVLFVNETADAPVPFNPNVEEIGTITPLNTPIVSNMTVNEAFEASQGQIDGLGADMVDGFLDSLTSESRFDFIGKSIYFFGDSYVNGTGANAATRWTKIASDSLGAVEQNFGTPGSTLQKRSPINWSGAVNMVDRVSDIPTKTTTMAMLVFAFGLNDMGYTGVNYTPENYQTDYSTVISDALGKGWLPSQIVLIAPYYIGSAGYAQYAVISGIAAPTLDRHLDFVTATKQVAIDFGLKYMDMYELIYQNNTTLFGGDPIHTNQAGHAYIGNIFAKCFGGGKLFYGNKSSIATATPLRLSLGGSYANSAGAPTKAKLLIYDDGTNLVGFGQETGGILATFCYPTFGAKWYSGTVLMATLDPTTGLTLVKSLVVGGVIRLKNYTVATLPAGTIGDTAYVTDATTPTYLGTLTGGGSVVCPVFYNGTAWVSH